MSVTDTGKSDPPVQTALAGAGRLRQRILAFCRWQGILGGMRTRPFLSTGIAAGCLAIIGAICAFVVFPQWRAYQHWWEAQQAVEDGELGKAREHLAHCVEAWPTSGETHFLMARTCRRAGDFEAAKQHLAKAAELNWPSDAIDLEWFLIPVQERGARGQNEEVLHGYLAIRHPEEKLILEAMVKGYIHAYRLQEARHWLNVWIERYPEDWRPWFWRGAILNMIRDFAAANMDLARGLELKPDYLPGRLQLAENLLNTRENAKEALHHFQTYLKSRPGDVDAMVGVGRCQSLLSETDAARSTLRKVLVAHPGHPGASLALGNMELELGNLEEALKLVKQADAGPLKEPGTIILLARILRQLNRHQEAEGYEKKHAELNQALKDLAQATQKLMGEPRNPDLRCKAGSIMLKVGQHEEGVRWLLSALIDDPKHQATHKALADYYGQSNDPTAQRLAEHHRQMAAGTGGAETSSPSPSP